MAASPGDPRTILVIRPDRLGDVILSTPVQYELAKRFPESRIFWLVQDWIAPLIAGMPGVAGVLSYEPRGRHAGSEGLRRLEAEIRALAPDVAVTLQSQRRIAWAVWRAGVRERIGPWSKLHSFLFYNRGVRQRRSQSVRHEAEYNLELLRPLGIAADPAEARALGPSVALTDEAERWAADWLSARGLRESEAIGVHPGMGGSALNWPRTNYSRVVESVASEGRPVVLTGGLGEESLVEAVLAEVSPKLRSRVHVCLASREGMDLVKLAALQKRLSAVLAPSTGPLHLASAVGARVVSLYPPIRVQHPRRWGPFVAESRARVFMPVSEAECGAAFRCRESACPLFPCMPKMDPAAVSAALLGRE